MSRIIKCFLLCQLSWHLLILWDPVLRMDASRSVSAQFLFKVLCLKCVVSSATGSFLQVLNSKCPICHPPRFIISHFLFSVFYYLPLQSSPGHGPSLISHFSVVSSGYMLTSNDSKLGSTNQREHADFVFLDLHYLTLSNIF